MTGGDALFARALALEDAGQPDQALACYSQLLASSPDNADAWHNRGLLLARLGRFEEAEQSHRDYVRAHPGSTRARGDLADVLLALGRYGDAVDAMESALEDAPGEATMLVRRGIALSCLRRFPEARESFARARSTSPEALARFVRRAAPDAVLDEMLSPENIFLARRYIAQGKCDWSGWEEYVTVMREVAADEAIAVEPAIAYNALVAPLSGRERHAIARGVAHRMEARIPAMPAPAPRQRPRIRVGVLSPDLREHVVGRLLLPLFELIDRRRFEIFAYSFGLDDGGPVRSRLRAAATAFRSVEALTDAQAAATIRADDIDILLDVCGHTAGSRFAITLQRPARVQAAYTGFSGSLGSRRIDYAIVDRIVAPDREEWTEGPAYLPTTYHLHDFRMPVRDAPVTRADYGLPADAFVFCAFHNADKITPESFALWADIVRQVPGSVLWFRGLSEIAIRHLRDQALARGMNPARLVFAPFEPLEQPRYLARQRLGDLMLDATHHNAITNACDALGAGLPVLTLRGTSMASRAGESLVRAAGLPEVVAADREAFVRSAVQLASNKPQLAQYRYRLESNRRSAPLFDTAGRVRDLEACFQEMLQVSDQSRSML